MNRTHGIAAWMIASFCIAFVLAGLVCALYGTGPAGLVLALKVTSRFSYFLFLGVYAGGTLSTLFGPAFLPIRQNVRHFGLGFAAAQAVHLGLVIWLVRAAPQSSLSGTVFWFTSIGLVFTYILAIFSIRRLAMTLGQWGWRLLRLVCLEYIALGFFIEFISHPLRADAVTVLGYLPFIILSVTATVLRIAAWASRGAAVVHRA